MKLLAQACSFVLIFGGIGFSQQDQPTQPSKTEHQGTPCTTAELPSSIGAILSKQFPAWQVQVPQDLGKLAGVRWKSEKQSRCPGITRGEFNSGKEPSYAVLLVPRGVSKNGYRFLAFDHIEGMSYSAVTLDESDEEPSSNFFIRAASVGRFFDEASRRKFHPEGKDVIVLVDCGDNEYEADVYFRTNGGYQHEPVDY